MKSFPEIVVLIVSLAIANQSIAQNVSQQPGNKVSFHALQNDGYRNFVEPCVFSNSATIYSQPDTTSAILQVVTLKTPLRLLAEGDDTKEIKTEKFHATGEKYTHTRFTVLRWYKVELKEATGYIKASDVAIHSFSNNSGSFNYFFVSKENCWLYKLDNTKKQFTDSLEIRSFRNDIVQSINAQGWKNVTMMFRATMINAYCGGGTTNVFIVDANGKLSELITTKSQFDNGSANGYSSDVWLPLKFNTGKVLLILNGDVDAIFDTYSGEFNTYSYPKELTIPKIELIVFKETEFKSLVDKKGELLLNADGSYKSRSIKATKYLKWNGTKLVPLK